ncbi:MAG: ABC transporter permease [Treponema sp.]|nr:ABC transporter permease [Treponema sp.]
MMMRGILAVFSRNITNFFRDRMRVIFSLLMSLLFMFVFSFAMKGAVPGMNKPLDYLAAGVIIMTVFQQALNNSTDILNDLSSGFMKEIIVSPVSRWQIAVGQICSSTAIACIQGIIILAVSMLLGLRISILSAFAMAGIMIIAGLTFASFGLFLATVSRNSSAFQILTNIIVMPLSFLSGAYIPVTVMPSFLNGIIILNPLTWITALFRSVALGLHGMPAAALVKEGMAFTFHGHILTPAAGFFFVLLFGLVFFFLCVKKFGSADFSSVKAVFKHRH